LQTKPTLLVLTSTFPLNADDGTPRFVLDLCLQLKQFYNIHVLCPHAPNLALYSEISGIHIHYFRYLPERVETLTYSGGILSRLKNNPLMFFAIPFFVVGEILAIKSLLRTIKPEAIHAHWLIPQGFSAIIARWLSGSKIPIICTSHGGDLYGLAYGPFKSVLRWVIRHSDLVTVVSNAMKNYAGILGAPTDHISVIPMGTDLSGIFRPPIDNQTRKQKRLLFAGRLVEKKGMPILIKAMLNLADEYPDLQLDIVGEGPDRNKLEKLTDDSGITDKIIFHGSMPHTELADYFRNATIAIIPSIKTSIGDQEGFGLVIVEALGCECPVIASNLPAIQDIVIDGKTGLLFSPGDINALTTSIKSLLNNPPERERLAKNGRSHVMDFDWNIIAKHYKQLIDSAISHRNQ
jgi:glycosyltransferase involved in cell wall biosynthesis